MTENFVPEEVRTQAAHRSTMVSVWVNILLSILQLLVGILAKSQALIADAEHSFSDLIADGIVLWANKYSAKAPDDDHPYGRSEERRVGKECGCCQTASLLSET